MNQDTSGGQVWLFASNPATFDAEKGFAADDEILWSETNNAHVRLGDTVFLYATKPTQELTHQCVVVKIGLPENSADTAATWADAVDSADAAEDLTTSGELRNMIVAREREKKGPRARLTPSNQRALDAWSGASGTSRFDYLWTNARRHLQDLYDAEAAA
jgi:hypothetical protein